MSTRSLGLLVAVGLTMVSVSAMAQQTWYWTGYISEETGHGLWCNQWNESPRGFGCSGSFCDNVRVLCDVLPNGISLDPASDYWTAWFSEEDDDVSTFRQGWYNPDQSNLEVCNWSVSTPAVMGGIACSGSYCDNISLECDVPRRPDGQVATFANCTWTSFWFSEENQHIDFFNNYFIAGIWCNGSYCDNKKFYVCQIS